MVFSKLVRRSKQRRYAVGEHNLAMRKFARAVVWQSDNAVSQRYAECCLLQRVRSKEHLVREGISERPQLPSRCIGIIDPLRGEFLFNQQIDAARLDIPGRYRLN